MSESPSFAVLPWPLAAFIEVTDEDAADFLQSQFSNDLRGGVGRAVPGLWLDHRGRLRGESSVLVEGRERFHLVSFSTPAAELLPRLESHVIADEVAFADRTGEAGALVLLGRDARAWWTARAGCPPPAEEAFVYQGDHYAYRNAWLGGTALVLVGAPAVLEALREAAVAAGGEEWCEARRERWRLGLGRPRIPAEAGLEDTPAETGLNAFCSLHKGCFLGQEVVNRQARLERSSRRLVRVRLPAGRGPLPAAPAVVETTAGMAAGELRGVVTFRDESIGLAVLKMKHLEASLRLAGRGDLTVEVMPDAGRP
jgi:tRNA-modifying protein YgfZ